MKKYGGWIIAGFFFGAMSFAQADASCSACPSEFSDLQVQKKRLQSYTDLNEKNVNYLAGLGPDDTSKRVKVKSNLVIIAIKLDTTRNNIEFLQQSMKVKCPECLAGGGG